MASRGRYASPASDNPPAAIRHPDRGGQVRSRLRAGGRWFELPVPGGRPALNNTRICRPPPDAGYAFLTACPFGLAERCAPPRNYGGTTQHRLPQLSLPRQRRGANHRCEISERRSVAITRDRDFRGRSSAAAVLRCGRGRTICEREGTVPVRFASGRASSAPAANVSSKVYGRLRHRSQRSPHSARSSHAMIALGPKASASADRGAAKVSRSRETGGRWAPAGPKWS